MVTREHCAICGWPRQGSACPACGAGGASGAASDEDYVNLFVLAGPRPEDFPELKNAFIAWRQKDWNRFVGQCLLAVGVESPLISNLADGPGWSFTRDSAAIYIAFDKNRVELSIESPIVTVPKRNTVPLLRTLLDLNARALGAARFCLRGNLVVLRFADRMENLSPPKLVAAIKEVATCADRYDDVLSLSFAAKMMGPEAQKQHLSWRAIGVPCRLKNLFGEDDKHKAPIAAATDAPASLPWWATELAAKVQSADQLCGLLHQGLDLGKPLAFMKLHPAVSLLLHRALLFRVWYQFRDTCPHAASLLMHQGAPILVQVWESSEGLLGRTDFDPMKVPTGAAMDSLYVRVIAQRAQVPPEKPYVPELIKSVAEAKAHFRKYLAEVEKGPKDEPFRHFVLLGALAELLSRIRLPAAFADRVRQTYTEGQAQTPSASSVGYLLHILKGVVA